MRLLCKDLFFPGLQTDDVSVNWTSVVLLPGLTFILKYQLEIRAAQIPESIGANISRECERVIWIGLRE